VHSRSILTGILPLLLGGVLVNACDKKEEPKTDDKKVVAKADEKKADEKKAEDLVADEAKADEGKADEAKADDLVADDAGGADAAADEGKADDMKADPDTKADDVKADPDTKGEKKGEDKADDKKGETKADDKKGETKADPAAAKIDGKKLFSEKCASCHGSSGKADTKLGEKHKIANWTEPGWKAKWSLSKVEDIVTKGKADTKMKAFAGKLTPEEIKAVSKYAHGLGK
jgi:cytochrome c553